jgi:hypothetical protein
MGSSPVGDLHQVADDPAIIAWIELA